jgi:hypothetical protein
MTELAGKVGFASPATEKKVSRRRAGIELFATLSLAASLMIAATAVSIGMTRAQTFGAAQQSSEAPLALVVVLGLILGGMILVAMVQAGMGGLTAIAAREPQSPPR